MTNRTLTALIVRLAGFALFIKIFDFFGSYFVSIYMSSTMAVLDETSGMVDSFNKLYYSGTVLAFTNLALALVLIFKADWISRKLTKSESEIKIELTAQSVMRIVIATLGIIYLARTLYYTPNLIEDITSILNWKSDGTSVHHVMNIISYSVRAVIGTYFIIKSEQLAIFAMKRIKSL